MVHKFHGSRIKKIIFLMLSYNMDFETLWFENKENMIQKKQRNMCPEATTERSHFFRGKTSDILRSSFFFFKYIRRR